MARTDVSATMAARIADRNRFPVYFIEIGWDTGGGVPLRLCSSGVDMSDGTNTWKGVGARVHTGNMNQVSAKYTVTVPDNIPGDVNKISDYLQIQGRSVKTDIRLFYDANANHSSWLEADSIWLINGIIVGAPQIRVDFLVTLTIARPIAARQTPFVSWGPPTTNHDRPAGARVRAGSVFIDIRE